MTRSGNKRSLPPSGRPSEPSRAASAHRIDRRIPLGLFAVTIAAYLPALQAGFIWDDDGYVTHNLTLRTLDGLRRIWLEPGATPQYYPLVHTTFWIEYHLWGLTAAGYHLVNICLHALNAVLVWRILQRLAVPGAIFAAAIFALHPVHVESVAWITERKNVLSGLFYLSAMLAFIRFRWPAPGAEAASRSLRPYGAMLLLFIAALLSKSVTATLPAAMLLIVWWREGRIRIRDVSLAVPMLLIGAASGGLTLWMEMHNLGGKGVGAVGEDWALDPLERLLIVGRAFWFYLGKLLWPHPLIFIYERWRIDSGEPWQYLFPAAAIAMLSILLLLRRLMGRGPLTAALFFAGTLAPALGFFNVYPFRFSFVADHFQYLASLGPISLAAAAMARLSKRRSLPAGSPKQMHADMERRLAPFFRPAHLAIVAVIGALGALTSAQTRIYQNLEVLWIDTLTKNPACWMALTNLGKIQQSRGRWKEAESTYRKALEFKPDMIEARNNLGAILLQQGKLADAVPLFEKLIHDEPGYLEARSNLGLALKGLKRYDDAIACYRDALRIREDLPSLHSNLGAVYHDQGKYEQAAAEFRRAIALDGRFIDARIYLAIVLDKLGRRPDAITAIRDALQIDPKNKTAAQALINLTADPTG